MKYSDFVKDAVSQAVKNLDTDKSKELFVKDIAQEVEKLLKSQGITLFNANSRSGQTSVGMAMSKLGYISRRITGESTRWFILKQSGE